METQGCWTARILHETRIGQCSLTKPPAAGFLNVYSLLLKAKEMPHSGKMAIFQLFRCVAAIKF